MDLIRKFFRKVREYHRAYSKGSDMKKIMKLCKSHQRVSEATLEIVESILIHNTVIITDFKIL